MSFILIKGKHVFPYRNIPFFIKKNCPSGKYKYKFLSSLTQEFDFITHKFNSQLFLGISSHIFKELKLVFPEEYTKYTIPPQILHQSCSTYSL